MLPFNVLAKPQPKTLTITSFLAGKQSPGILSAALTFMVPLGQMLFVKGGGSIRFFLKAREIIKFAADNTGSKVLDLGALGHDLIRSSRPWAGAFPSQAHPDVVVYTSSDNGVTYARGTIDAVDFAANTVTVATSATTNCIKVYFVPGGGEFEIRAKRPNGSDSINLKIFDSGLRAMHETDQVNQRSQPKIGQPGTNPPLPPQWELQIAVRSNSLIFPDPEAEHELSIQAFTAPIQILNRSQMDAEAEKQLRGGYF